VETQWIVFASVLFLNTAMALVIATLLLRRHSAPGLMPLVLMLYLLALWSFSYAMITLSPGLEAKRFWLRVENIGILTVPPLWFFFTIQYTRLDKWLNRFTGALFFIVPLISLVCIFSNGWFGHYYLSIQPFSVQGGPLVVKGTQLYFVTLVQSYLLNLIAIGLLVWRAIQYRDIYRRQMFALIAAAFIPILVNVFYQFAPRIIPSFTFRVDLTPISFTISAALVAFGVFGLRIFDLIPIARYIVMEHIPEMVFVVDSQNRILDANIVAQELLGKSPDEIIGQNPVDVFHDWPEIVKRHNLTGDIREEIVIPGNPPRTVDLVISTLYDRFNNVQGRVIVAHDITEHKQLEQALKDTNQSLMEQLAENEKLQALLQEQAIRDPLTNVYNRRFMAEFLDNEIVRAEREQSPVSIVILDMDNFRQFNDAYGHRCGDVVLQEFSKFLVDRTRRGDVVCRYGGEEFVVIMPNAILDVAHERADTWRQGFAETTVRYEDMRFSATFSAGVASFPEHGLTGDSLLQAADRALYRSKNNGRNRVTMAVAVTNP
jgi:diguanylate cyclase (GGDEF)-like protein/PAS domain S-box-containing protein